MLTMAACSGNATVKSSRAASEGAKAAEQLINDMPMSDIDLQNRLLTIRDNEYRMRRDGNAEAADRYIESFEQVIKQNSDSLTTILGYEKATD